MSEFETENAPTWVGPMLLLLVFVLIIGGTVWAIGGVEVRAEAVTIEGDTIESVEAEASTGGASIKVTLHDPPTEPLTLNVIDGDGYLVASDTVGCYQYAEHLYIQYDESTTYRLVAISEGGELVGSATFTVRHYFPWEQGRALPL